MLLLLAFALGGVIFLVDLVVSNVLAIGALYCIVILYSWLLPGKNTSVWAALFCCFAVIINFIATLQEGAQGNDLTGINTLIAIIAIGVSASLVTIAKYGYKELEGAKNELEEKVAARTKDLEESERNFRLMVENVKDYAIILLDSKGTIISWNRGAEHLTGYSREVIGENFSTFYKSDDTRKADALLHSAIENSFAYREGWRLRQDKTKFWAGETFTPIMDKEDQLSGFSMITRDLTERKKAEMAQQEYIDNLDQKNLELEQFAYVAAHDLQEPLRTLNDFTGLLKADLKDHGNKEVRTSLDFISQASVRMSDLVKGLLEYSRIGREKEVEIVDTRQLVEEVKQDLQATIKETGAALKIVDTLPTIKGHRTELRLLFQNLISNAVKFRKPEETPVITISSAEIDGFFSFAIQDNGIGIPSKFLDKIFVIFKRLHNRKDYEGTGIGLAHCQKIVRLHQGRIWVESQPGVGSVFRFTLKK